MMPIANSRFSQNGSPMAWPIAKNSRPRPQAIRATSRDRRRISRFSGETASPAVCVRWAMRPNSVCIPVAYTAARASPDTSAVPASSRLPASSGASSALGAALRARGPASPVSVAAFTRTHAASISRQSAGTLSPSASSTMSPGTRPPASIRTMRPSRSASTWCGSSRRSAAIACSARYSCQKEKTPLTRMTPTIATPSRPMPWPGS